MEKRVNVKPETAALGVLFLRQQPLGFTRRCSAGTSLGRNPSVKLC